MDREVIVMIDNEMRHNDAEPDECEYWQKLRAAKYPALVTGYKCGRCEACCDEGDALYHARKENQ